MHYASLDRPGIEGPPRAGAAIAAGVIVIMGFYGFATAVQKAGVTRDRALAAAPRLENARMAVAVGDTPSLVYAVTDPASTPRPAAVAARASQAKPPAPVIPAEQTEVRLAAAPLVSPAQAAAETPAPAAVASIESLATNAVAVEAAAENVITP